MHQDGHYLVTFALYQLNLASLVKDTWKSASSNPLEDGDRHQLILFLYKFYPCRADEWDVNKWAWEGALKVVSKGEECIIKLVDKTTGELYAQAFLREGELHPVEAVIDSSR